ncbi:MAG: CBS domain-containing protein [Rhodoferax sp.]|nr:CBS domain-containing protein [Betaproteobacteria bacterium]NCN97964.1 CBS domain-containing protein [Rhodoferax sp.]NCS62333.1 CBS domain-containing protein [Rhodoferax sp.]OIP16195.1 MAG: hypothetical protein AUK50_09440 [Comamonadaceae bacterium CG2_30_57_122]PJC20148.1 MAG: histidine kinase [Comamonadaceae bacterium CG_4_9_14_0_8_um_filter_57_21]
MFSIYGTSGQLFRGNLEQLRQVGGVGALARTRAILPVARDGRDPGEAGPGALPTGVKHPAVLDAYAQTQQGLQQRRPLTRVADLMNTQPVTLPDTATVLQAWQLLANKGIGQAPVVDAAGHLVGLLTRADLLKPERLPDPDAHALVWRALQLQSVKDIMWTPVPSAAPDSDIRHVARVLLDTGLPGLPVVDEQGQVSGFVSRSDILRAVVADPPLDLWG